jgi:long-chain fatty acid transport protein
MAIRLRFAGLAVLLGALGANQRAEAQTFGVELHNTLMPAAGAMAGVSIAQPQDLISAINANPATLTQFRGTQFIMGGSWGEPTVDIAHQQGVLPALGTFSAKSEAQGVMAPAIGVTQDLSMMGLPATFGIGFVSSAGGFVDFRQVPQSAGTNSALSVFEAITAVGVNLTERLSVGASMAVGLAMFDAPFVGIGGETLDYALRGVLGASYDLTPDTKLGLYWQTRQHFVFDNAVRLVLPDTSYTGVFDVRMDLPENVGVGISNTTLMDGNLMLAADLLWKQWDNADMFKAVYNNQWVGQFGAQYTAGKCRYRLGYAYSGSLLDPHPSLTAGGITPPGGQEAMYYTQALLAVANPHRLTGGVGVHDVLPGIDLDVMAGGMFDYAVQEGPLTASSMASYWVGLGLTWRFGAEECDPTVAATCSDVE